MSTITVDQLMSESAISRNFEKSFVEKMVNALPEILSMKQDELTFGTVAKTAKVPRGQAGKFLKTASSVKEWAIDVINGKPHKKDTSDASVPNKDTTISTGNAEVNSDSGADELDPVAISRAIIVELQRPPMDEEIGFNYASIPHLAETTGAPIALVEGIVDLMTKKGMLKPYDGEVDFEEKVFMLSNTELEKAKQEAKAKEPVTAKPVAKEISEEVKSAPVTETTVDADENNTDDADETDEALNFSKKTLDSVVRALKQDKYTKNGIINKVAKKGVHKRADVTGAFEFLITNGDAIPTNDGGAREYFTIPSKRGASVEKAKTESVAVIEKEVAPKVEDTKPSEVESVSVNQPEVESKAPLKAASHESSEMETITSAIGTILTGTIDSINSGDSLANIRKKLKAALLMVEAAEEIE